VSSRRNHRPIEIVHEHPPFPALPDPHGRSVEVKHPEWIAYAGGRIALVAMPDDSFEVIDLLLVPSLEAKAGDASRSG
jgi:hypothetical protein